MPWPCPLAVFLSVELDLLFVLFGWIITDAAIGGGGPANSGLNLLPGGDPAELALLSRHASGEGDRGSDDAGTEDFRDPGAAPSEDLRSRKTSPSSSSGHGSSSSMA